MKINNTIVYKIFGSMALVALIAACGRGPNDPGTEYMPDMYVSQAYEPFTQLAEAPNKINADGKNMREPAKRTIAQGQLDYYYPYEKEQYDDALKNVKMPETIARNPENLAIGKHFYDINCYPCHGDQGLGDGPVSVKFPPNNIPSYASDRIQTLAEGGMYHSIKYGKNYMGSYASVLTPTERWCVIQYVQYLSKKAKASTPATATVKDSTKKGN